MRKAFPHPISISPSQVKDETLLLHLYLNQPAHLQKMSSKPLVRSVSPQDRPDVSILIDTRYQYGGTYINTKTGVTWPFWYTPEGYQKGNILTHRIKLSASPSRMLPIPQEVLGGQNSQLSADRVTWDPAISSMWAGQLNKNGEVAKNLDNFHVIRRGLLLSVFDNNMFPALYNSDSFVEPDFSEITKMKPSSSLLSSSPSLGVPERRKRVTKPSSTGRRAKRGTNEVTKDSRSPKIIRAHDSGTSNEVTVSHTRDKIKPGEADGINPVRSSTSNQPQSMPDTDFKKVRYIVSLSIK